MLDRILLLETVINHMMERPGTGSNCMIPNTPGTAGIGSGKTFKTPQERQVYKDGLMDGNFSLDVRI